MAQEPFDLVFRQVRLDSTEGLSDVVVDGGRIAMVMPHPAPGVSARTDIAGDGGYLVPPFVDSHEHLDCAFMLGEGNRSGTLAEAIDVYSEEKRVRTVATIRQKAELAVTEALSNGTCFIRSHTDTDSIAGEKHLAALLELREAYRGRVDIQIVACMQYSFREEPRGEECLRTALESGADLVGGVPEFEPTEDEARRHMQIVFDVAKDYDVDIDMHIDQTSNPAVRTLEMLADMTMAEDYQGRVTAGHACALAAYETNYAKTVIQKVKDAGIHIVTNPLTNLYLQGRRNGTPTWRGITLVKELLQAGVNVACGLDDTANMFMPFGRMNMLEAALFTSLLAHMTSQEELTQVLRMCTYNGARIMGVPDYGVTVGAPANFVILPVDGLIDGIRLQPLPRYVVRSGKIIAENCVEPRSSAVLWGASASRSSNG